MITMEETNIGAIHTLKMSYKESRRRAKIFKKVSRLLRKMLRIKIWIKKILAKINERISYWEEKGRIKTGIHEQRYKEYFEELSKIAEENRDILIDGKHKSLKFTDLGTIKWYFSKPKLTIFNKPALLDFIKKQKGPLGGLFNREIKILPMPEQDLEKLIQVLEISGLTKYLQIEENLDIPGLEILAAEEAKKDPQKRLLLNSPFVSYDKNEYFSVELVEIKAGEEAKKIIRSGIKA